MSILVVLDKFSGSQEDAFEFIRSIGTPKPTESIQLINLTDYSTELVKHHLDTLNNPVTYINGFDIYVSLSNEFNCFLSRWLRQLLTLQPQILSIEYSRLSEQNFSLDLFRNLRLLHLLDHEIKSFRPERLLYIGDGITRDCISNLCEKHSVLYTIYPRIKHVHIWRRLIRPYWQASLLFGHNLWSEFLLLISIRLLQLLKPRGKQVKKYIGVYAVYPSAWHENEGVIRYRYTNSLLNHINDVEHTYYLISLLRTNSDALRSLPDSIRSLYQLFYKSPDITFEVLEAYGNIFALIATYFDISRLRRWLVCWHRARRSGYWQCFGISIEPILKDIFLSQFREIPKNIYTEFCSKEVANWISPEHLYIPVFELLEGRAVTAGHHAHNVNVIGIQHGIMYNLQIPRAVGSLMQLSNTTLAHHIPDLIAVEGDEVRKLYIEHEFPNSRVRVVGAPRINFDTEDYSKDKNTKLEHRRNVLLFDDVYSSDNLSDFALRLSENSHVVFKSHPTKQAAGQYTEFTPNETEGFVSEIEDLSASELVRKYKPIAAICCLSGASIDMIMLGVPVILILSNRFPMVNPIIGDVSQIPILNNISDVHKELNTLRNSTLYHESRISAGQKQLSKLVQYAGDDACRRLANLVLLD